MLSTSNHNKFQRQSTKFFNHFFCKFQLTRWHNMELPGKRVLSRALLDYVGLIPHYLLQDKYYITLFKFCAKLLEILFAWVFVWNMSSDSVWSLPHDSDKDSRTVTLYQQSLSVRWIPFPWFPICVNFSDTDCLISRCLSLKEMPAS